MIEIFTIDDDLLISRNSGGIDYTVRGCVRKDLVLKDGQSCFGVVVSGTCAVRGLCEPGELTIGSGSFFSLPRGSVSPREDCSALMIVCNEYTPLPLLGGAVEKLGRLTYVDGCSDTLLIPPPRRGDPCLNHLHMPAGTKQRMHFHPSDRVGVILRGYGECRTHNGTRDLQAGQGWLIPEGMHHCYNTGDSAMDVIAWHPDSDYGPTDANHPMINRTWTRPEDATRS